MAHIKPTTIPDFAAAGQAGLVPVSESERGQVEVQLVTNGVWIERIEGGLKFCFDCFHAFTLRDFQGVRIVSGGKVVCSKQHHGKRWAQTDGEGA